MAFKLSTLPQGGIWVLSSAGNAAGEAAGELFSSAFQS